jgi:hypothetical protein
MGGRHAQTVARRVSASRLEQLYDGSSADLKRASSKEDFIRLLDAVHRKLGEVKESKQVGWRVNYATGGSVVDLVYETRFAAGKGREEFVYRAAKQPSLLGSNINSSDRIVRQNP